ncbi:Homoserine kinase [Granulicella sibirica]|uniref:Homoserine kinase n=2 Tax=Granulicella sibirica TaxID=2479048 RepID=A0A4V1L5Q2_9BACT|nr:Homoserine kinase [Granulicella sibirica]
MSLYLNIEAGEAVETSIQATGRNPDLAASLERNLILTTYREVLAAQGKFAPHLSLKVHNEIPLGMGCGSSAAALLAGVHLANHFGDLGWTPAQVMTEACLREGHPDNVAACALGGMTTSCQQGSEILTATCGLDLPWRLLLALPGASLATEKARALLPDSYSRADAVANIQRSSLLVAAFALNRPDLLHIAMRDRIHQPYRSEACPLLPRLLPLLAAADAPAGIWGAALSGAGPSVLLILDPEAPTGPVEECVRQAAEDSSLELVQTTISVPAEVTY